MKKNLQHYAHASHLGKNSSNGNLLGGSSSNRNLILAVVLSAFVIIGWGYLFPVKNEKSSKSLEDYSDISQKADETQNATPNINSLQNQLNEKPQKVIIQDAKKRFEINTQGLKVDGIKILGDDIHSPLVDSSTFLQVGFLSQTNAVPHQGTVWKVVEQKENSAKFETIIENIKFVQSIWVDKNSMLQIQTEVHNAKQTPISVKIFSRVNQKITEMPQSNIISHEGPIAYLGKQLHEKHYKKVLKSNFNFVADGEENPWFGFSDKYHLIAFVQKDVSQVNFVSPREFKNTFQADSLSSTIAIEAGESFTNNSIVFVGIKTLKALENASRMYNIPHFDKSIDFGVLYFITKPLFLFLSFLYHHLGSFAIAIVVLTCIIKLILMPLTVKSSLSMAKMKALQPQIKQLQEQHKGNKHALGQATVKLYREKQVNPLAGCLPMIVQIPIFFSLYKVLYVSTEMKNQPLFFWINDLSEPDPTSILNLFGLLPFEAPPFLGVLPILFGVSMFFYQLSSPQPADKTQAKIMKMLPVVMTIFLSGFASGLLFYWIVSNVFSIIQQFVIEKVFIPIHHKNHHKKHR